jgi:tetratricopeptide (TPR) repeat protein
VTVLTKVKEYKLASLECKALADKFAFFRNQEMLDSALQAAELKVRMSIALSLDESPLGDSEALLDYAEVLMDKGELEKGIVKVKEALVQVHPLNARSAACWNLLVKGLFLMELNEESLQAFDQGLTCLNFHWGQNHPFACLLANRLAELHARKMNFREALDLMKFSLLVCMKTIGPNHVFTAGVNMKIGQIQQSCGNPEISASYLEKAYLVFEAYHGLGSLITGKSAATLSEVLVSLGRYQEARKLISTSCQVYQSYLDKNDEVRASLFEKSKILNEFYFACLVGLVIGLKTNEFELVKIFADKLWTIISQSEDPDFMIVLQIIEYVLKAKLNLLGAKKTAKLNYFVTVKAKIQDTDLEAIKTNFLSPSFLISVECKGGIVTFIEKLVDKVSFYSDLSEKDINWLKLESSVSELKAMMEINTQICN